MTDRQDYTELIADARRLIADCRTYNFGMWNADRLAHEVAGRLVLALEVVTAERDALRAEKETGEPEAGDEFLPGECDGSGKCSAPVHVHGCFAPHKSSECESPEEYGHIEETGGNAS